VTDAVLPTPPDALRRPPGPATLPPIPAGAAGGGLRPLHVVRRNYLVWRKLLLPSLTGNLADPFIYLIGLGFGLGAFMPPIAGVPYIAFLAGGMICYSTMNSASFEALYSAFSRLQMQRTWEGILHAPMTVTDIVLGEWLWAGLKATLSGASILLVMYVLGIARGVAPFAVLPLAFVVGLCFAGIALVMTTLAKSYDFFVFYFTLVVTPMMFLSGVFFPRESLPAVARGLSEALPLTHAVELSRALALGGVPHRPLVNLAVLLAFGIAGVALACRLAERRLAR
jgi:lipooligosaccharide transport system permease protein